MPTETHFAVPYSVLETARHLLDEMPHRVSRNIVPALERCLRDDHKVEFATPEDSPIVDAELMSAQSEPE